MREILKNKSTWLFVAVVIVLGIFFLGKDNSSNGGGSTPAVSINKDIQNKCLAEVNDSLFCKFAGTWANVQGYKTVASVATESGKTQMLVTIASNGNGSMSVDEGSGVTSRIVVFNGVTYVQNPTDNSWQQYSGTEANKPALLDIKKEFLKSDFKADSGQKINYVNKGTEAIGKLTCYKYQIEDPSKTGETGYMWFDNKDFLLRKLSSKDSSTDMQMTFSYENTNVSLPSPIKGNTVE